MQNKKTRKARRIEIVTGFIILLASFNFLASLLFDFKFVSPDGTLLEDLTYLSENTLNNRVSAWFWITTAIITLAAIPFYLVLFYRKLQALQYVNALFMLVASVWFLLMGNLGIELHHNMMNILGEGLERANEQMKLSLLEQFSQEQFYRKIGSSFVGLFAIGLGMTRFRIKRFPILSSILLIISGPTLIFLNWYNPEHLIRTGAMAGIMIGVVIFCVRLINRGLPVNRPLK